MSIPCRVLRCLIVAHCIALSSGCGLPQLFFLVPPTADSITNTPPEPSVPLAIQFSHNTLNNNDNFRGYSLYYKFYDHATNATGCRNDRNLITGDPVVLGLSRLESRGYRQIVLDNDPANINDDPANIISINDRNTSRQFRILILDPSRSEDEEVPFRITGANIAYNLYRETQSADSNSRYKPLYANPASIFSAGDVDLQGILASVFDSENFYIAFYGVARGIDSLSLTPVYSEPRFLGYVSLRADPRSASRQCNDGLNSDL